MVIVKIMLKPHVKSSLVFLSCNETICVICVRWKKTLLEPDGKLFLEMTKWKVVLSMLSINPTHLSGLSSVSGGKMKRKSGMSSHLCYL